MSQYHDPDRSHSSRGRDAQGSDDSSRAGAGSTAAKVYGDAGKTSGTAGNDGTPSRGTGLPFMDVMLQSATSAEQSKDAQKDTRFRHVADADAPVTRGEAEENRVKGKAVANFTEQMNITFGRMIGGVEIAVGHLEPRRVRKPDLMTSLIEMAASAAVAGAAGVVAQVVARHFASGLASQFATYKDLHERFSTDALKDHLKRAFKVGTSASWDLVGDVVSANFHRAQLDKVHLAQSEFHSSMESADLEELPLDFLDRLVADATNAARDSEITRASERSTSVEWANLVAKLRHGGEGWDFWAGEHGSTHAIPTERASGPPVGDNATSHPSNNNVAAQSDHMRDIVDNDQRKMNPGTEGILEIDIMAGANPKGRERWSLFERSGFGMRLNGVSDYVKSTIAEFPTVGDVKMNKIVSAYSDLSLNPPKPWSRFLITADGYIRRWTSETDTVDDLAAFAQSLPTSLLR